MRWKPVVASLGFLLLAPSASLADGGPVGAMQGGAGIGAPGSQLRFIAAAAGRDTVVRRVSGGPRHVQATLRVTGRYGIPGADYRGTLTGLSADGRTLVLEPIIQAFPVRTTRLLVLDTRRMRIERRIVLAGWSTVDAISPDGRWIYLIHYSASDFTRYEVQAYDLRRGRLLLKPIVDPEDRGEAMTGYPLQRVMGPGGRWAYTLYSRPDGVPFVHALDTAGLRAVCVDLPSLRNLDFGQVRVVLTSGGQTLQLRIRRAIAATISTRTFAVSTADNPWGTTLSAPAGTPEPPSARPAGGGGGGGGGGSVPWEIVFVPIAAAAALVAAVRRRAKPRAA